MEKKIHKILVCIDFSEYSVMTLGYALELAKDPDTLIMALNVIHQRDISGVEMAAGYFPGYFSTPINTEEYIKTLKEERHENLKKLILENFPGQESRVTLKVGTGLPWEAILDTVDSEDIDLVVMANKGRGNIARVLFGSAAEKVFRHSPVPVVSVRDKTGFTRGG
jgi:nucleotide-binding universal stress UspA family protein